MKKYKILIEILLIFVVALVIYTLQKPSDVTSRQEMIHESGSHVMPFNLDETLHVFSKTENGGIQSIVVRDTTDTENLGLIRMHLQMEAQNFAKGDFSDPSSLHGETMPGLSVLEVNYPKLKVTYSEIEDGAEINFETTDVKTMDAIHDWFNAQVSDHGDDAVMQ